jgi:hypothetical protein
MIEAHQAFEIRLRRQVAVDDAGLRARIGQPCNADRSGDVRKARRFIPRS